MLTYRQIQDYPLRLSIQYQICCQLFLCIENIFTFVYYIRPATNFTTVEKGFHCYENKVPLQ